MIEAFTHGAKTLKKISLVEAAKVRGKNIVWVDCKDPNDEELHSIAQLIGITVTDLEVCLDEAERPRVEANHDFTMIILKSAAFYDKSIETTPLGIFIKGKYVLTLRIEDIKAINGIKSNVKSNILKKKVPYFIYLLTSKIVYEFDESLDKIEDEIDIIERDILNKIERNYMEETFALKKTLIYSRKAFKTNTEVIKSLRLGLAFKLEETDKELYSDLYQDARQLVDMEEINRDRLTEILNVHLSTVSNDLNKIMKSFTVIASLVFVPTLISGIYGMNFKYMPELTWKYGYQFALFLMFASVFLMGFYFKKKGYLK